MQRNYAIQGEAGDCEWTEPDLPKRYNWLDWNGNLRARKEAVEATLCVLAKSRGAARTVTRLASRRD